MLLTISYSDSALFTFLINTADKEIYNIFNSFLFPYYFITNRTNKQTNKHKSSFNNKDMLRMFVVKQFISQLAIIRGNFPLQRAKSRIRVRSVSNLRNNQV